MTITATDMFCGAGGSSLGASGAGVELVMAANHWEVAIDVHQANFPNAAHDLADISGVDPRRWPRTDILIASPECVNHSQARGVSRRRQDPTLWDAPDPAAERSRATMWDVVRFAEQMIYAAVIVENVVEVTRWVLFPSWLQAMKDLGYEHAILSHNAMHFGIPQSRDRVYMVFWRPGLRPNLELELPAHCPRCDVATTVRQAWKNGRTVGRYRQQWFWACIRCGKPAEPPVRPATDVIDFRLPSEPIGGRKKALVPNTRYRVAAGLVKHGWVPLVTAGAGHVHERTPGNRSHPVSEPLTVVSTTATHALVEPHPYLVQSHHGGSDNCRTRSVQEPMWTVAASDDRPALLEPMIIPSRNNGRAWPTSGPAPTVTAGGTHHALLEPPPDGLVIANNPHNTARSTDQPIGTITTSGNRHALLMRNNRGGAEMVTPVDEPARTMTSKAPQSLLLPYNRTGLALPTDGPVGTILTKEAWALLTPRDRATLEEAIDACLYRMLEPPEIAGFQAFPPGYIPTDLPKKHQIKLAGNAVPHPKMQWIVGRVVQAMEAA